MNLKRWIVRYPLLTFFVLAYAITWILLVPLAVIGEDAASFALVFVVVSAFGPPLAALIVIWIAEGRAAVRRWASRLVRWRVPWWWYLAALLVPFLIVALAYGIYLLFGGAPLQEWTPPSPLLFVATLLFILILGGGQEEPGWRGFALPRLQARYNALLSSLILGVIWTFWHLPLFLLPGTTQSELSFVWYMFLTPAVTLFLTWIFNNTRGSLLPVMLFHAAVNTAPGLLPLDLEGGLVSMRTAVLIAAWLLIAVLVAVFGPRGLTSAETWRRGEGIRHPLPPPREAGAPPE